MKIFSRCVPDFLKPLSREVKFRLAGKRSEKNLKAEAEDLRKQWHAIIKNSKDFIDKIVPQAKNKHILFVTGYGLGVHYLTIEPLLMMSLFARGCRISSLFCNLALPACEFNATGNNNPPADNHWKSGILNNTLLYQCSKCAGNILSTYSILPIRLYGYDQYLNEQDYAIAEEAVKGVLFESFRQWEYEGIKVGEEAFASVLRATFMGTISDTPWNRKLVHRYLLSGVLMARAAMKAYESLKPDRIVLIHGVYLTHGIATKVANRMGIPVVVVGGGGIRKDTVIVCHHETYHRQLVNESNSVWEKFSLSEAEKKKTINYAVKKRNSGGSVDYISYHPNPIENVEAIYKSLNIDKSRPIISVYTNVIWDAQIFYDSNAFKDIFDWIFTTIAELGENRKIWGIIRVHPAEKKGATPTSQPMLGEINKSFAKLPSNIRLISPESNISSYCLAKESKAAIIYGTKMGLEIALMKVPLIICGETFSRGKGFGLDILSKKQYVDVLKDIHNYPSIKSDEYERAIKYAHYYYFRKMIDLPITTLSAGTAGGGRKINIKKLSDLLPGKNLGIDTICEGILNMEPFYINI